MTDKFDTIVVGTGFASTFFLHEYLRHAPASARILVLDRGRRYEPGWRLQNRRGSDFRLDSALINRTPNKVWVQNVAFGGGTCWTGNTPRMHPHDFETKTRYGRGVDWPFGYDELEADFLAVERLMGISGAEGGPFPRSAPYPAPPHRMHAFERLLADKFPGHMLPMPSARSSASKVGRTPCCVNNLCATCPILAKFQVDQHMTAPYRDPRVTLRLESEVFALDVTADRVTGVAYRNGDREHRVACDLVALGTHAIFNPFIMQRSGITGGPLGKYLNEQWSVGMQLDLDGVDSMDGSQVVSGLGTMFWDGDFRAERPGCLIESWNAPWLRAEPGRYRQRAYLRFVFEDEPTVDSRVEVAAEDADKPAVHTAPETAYALAGRAHVQALAEQLVADLPVEGYRLEFRELGGPRGGEAHIQGTTRMGKDPATSVVDPDLRHHRVRNLLALGSGTFPTCMPANPTMPLSALSVRAARKLFEGAVQ